ncbi:MULTISPECIES: MFS transporter [Streptomyces albidoflavus group]|uniref:MFS transporter n=1 Tax=Streptomyces albidoflavus TaxID=1886 RepID=A0ABY3GS94_9ACTN|nr:MULTISPECIES: MFS transporter [Streptomyces albidoflavus group]TWV16363.1 MFS transporter [Streptomyces albidoflavus]
MSQPPEPPTDDPDPRTDEPGSGASESSARAGRAVLALVIAASSLVVIDMTIVAIGLPDIRRDLGGSLADIQWVMVAYLITMGAVTQVMGSLSDAVGRRRVFLFGAALFTAASLACGLAPGVYVLDVARAVQGVGGAILMVNALPLLSHQFAGERRNMAISTWGSAATAVGLLAPLLGGVLVEWLSWRALFLVNLPVGLAILALGLRHLPADTPPPGAVRTVRRPGALLLVAALGLGNFALLRGADQGWTSAATLLQSATALALLALFLRGESRADAPLFDLALFRAPAFTGAALAVFMSRVLTIGGTVYFVQYFHDALHLGPVAIGLLLAPVFLAQMAAAMAGGKLLTRFAPGHVIATGYACKAAGAALLALAFPSAAAAAHPWLLALPLLVWGTGGGIAGAPVMAVAMNVTGRDRAGMVSGTITSLASIGAGLGTAALGVLYASRLNGAGSGGTPAPEAVASAAATVLYTSAALATLTLAAVLILISPRHTPAPARKASPG